MIANEVFPALEPRSTRWLKRARRAVYACPVAALVALLGFYLALLIPHVDAIVKYNNTYGGDYRMLAQVVAGYWGQPKSFWGVDQALASALRFLFHFTPVQMGYNPLFSAFLGYTILVIDALHPLDRVDIALNLFLLVANSVLVYLISRRGVGAVPALVAGFSYGIGLGALTPATGGYHSTIGMTFVLLGAYLLATADFSNLTSGRLILLGACLSCSAFASSQALPSSFAVMVLLLARLALLRFPRPMLIEKVLLVGAGLLIPVLYFGARDLWVYFTFHYPINSGQGPYSIPDLLIVFAGSNASIKAFLPGFYLDYVNTLGGAPLVGISILLAAFALWRAASLAIDLRSGAASMLRLDGDRSVLLIGLAVGGIPWLLMTIMRMPAVGRAYSFMAVFEALVLGLFLSWLGRFTVGRGGYGRAAKLAIPALVIAVQLTAVGAFVGAADDYTYHPERRYLQIANWDPKATVRPETEFPCVAHPGILTPPCLTTFLRDMRDQRSGSDSDYLVLRPAADFQAYGNNSWNEHSITSYLAWLVQRGYLKPVGSVPARPAIQNFLSEFWYYNIQLNKAPVNYPNAPWVKVFPLQDETVFRVSDIRQALHRAGFVLAWDAGQPNSYLGWRDVFDPEGTVTVATHAGEDVPKAWRFSGKGGLSLPYGAGIYYEHQNDEANGLDSGGDLALGFRARFSAMETGTTYTVMTLGAMHTAGQPAGDVLSVNVRDGKVVVSQGETNLAVGNQTAQQGAWNFVVLAKRQNRLRLWLNGKPEGEFTFADRPIGERGFSVGYDPTGHFQPLPDGSEVAQVFYGDVTLSGLSDGDVAKLSSAAPDALIELLAALPAVQAVAPAPAEVHTAWSMDESSGTNIADAGGRYDATAYNTDIVDGPMLKARRLNGKNAYVQTPLNLGGSAAVTVAMWLRVPPGPPQVSPEIVLDNGGTAVDNCSLLSTGTKERSFFWHCFGGDASFAIPPDKWVQLVLVADGASGKLEVYVDGQKVGAAESKGGRTFGLTPITIGKWSDWPMRFFRGDIDELQVWNRALLAQEMPAILRPAFGADTGPYVKVPLTPSSVEVSDFNGPGQGKESLVDGNPDTIWHVQNPPEGDEHWVLVDLGTPRNVRLVRVKPRRGVVSQIWGSGNAVLQASDDKRLWTSLGPLPVDKATLNNDDPQWLAFSVTGGEPFRYYRILIRDKSFLSLSKVELWTQAAAPSGVQAAGPTPAKPAMPNPATTQSVPQAPLPIRQSQEGLVQIPLAAAAVEVSDFNSPGERQESLVDGNPETIWHVKYPLQTNEHWVLIDLGKQTTVDVVRVKPRRGQVSQLWDGDNAAFQGSDDKVTWTPLAPLPVDKRSLNNDNPDWLSFPVNGSKPFRYYRILIQDRAFLSLADLQLLRRPGAPVASASQSTLQGLAQLPLTSDVVEVSDYNSPGEGKESLVDGNPETIWHVKYPPQTSEHWVLIDLGQQATVDAVRVKPRRGQVSQLWDGDNALFQGSDDKATWLALGPLPVDKKSLNNDNPDWLSFPVDGGKAFRYYRVLIRDQAFLSLAELQLLSRHGGSPSPAGR